MTKQQRNSKSMNWKRLDNAAKIFPPITHGAHTSVFRISCELYEEITPELLQKATEEALKCYPHMQMVLHRGIFWYYLEQSELKPVIVEEHASPCAPLYKGSGTLLFEVSWWKHKINLEVYHVLTDGTGAVRFFKEIIAEYLALKYPKCSFTPVSDKSSVYERGEDSFLKYYQPHSGRYGKLRKAFHLRGFKRPDGDLTVLEGVADMQQILDAAHRYNATLTVYLCAVLIRAIREEMRQRDLRRPVVLTVPVNLRNYFPTETARNFFGTIRVSYDFNLQNGEFSDIISFISESFKNELTSERLSQRMNAMSALEHNPFVRPVPLCLKNPVLRLSESIASSGETAAISNVGRLQLPDCYLPYIKGFSSFMANKHTMLCTCSFKDNFHMGFTSVMQSPEVQRRFFQLLVADGVKLEIRSNEYHASDSQEV